MATTLQNYSALKIAGEDATTFLQGQLTNDLTKLDGNWQFAGYCNPKGRLLAILILWRHEDDYYALLNAETSDAIMKRLRMFVLRSKVTIEPLSASIYAQPSTQAERGGVTLLGKQHKLDFSGRSLVVDIANETIDSEGEYLSDSDWQLANILDGIPQIDPSNSELFVPQMVNLDLLGGISFKKGCYTGQEIVARMHYLGKLKQRMYVCRISDTNLNDDSASGNKISLADDPAVVAGNIASGIINGHTLAVLRIEHSGKRLKTKSGDELQISETQPYEIPQENR